MPFKHFTETVLVVLLALATIVTGIAVSLLPPIPEGFVPWAIVFVAAIIYPAIFYPLLKSNRADYSFRALHFAPVGIALGWLLIQVAMLKEPRTEVAERIYTWGFGILPVAVVFVLLAVFCLQVIRRRIPRLAFLIVFLVPFAALAFATEQYTHWDNQIAAVLWNQPPLQIAQQSSEGTSSVLSVSSRGEKNLSTSSVPEEEAWRQKLRSVERGSVHSESSKATISVGGTIDGVNAALEVSGQKSSGKKHVVKKPATKLPKSGGEMDALGLLALAGFAGTVHLRNRKEKISD
ncbi:MAG: hypothetical protein HOO67_01395 [Candidatus Peribacteraceae bacterium]|nr:hypothetical protein [Candidatus Peribacteraceae bacterium]